MKKKGILLLGLSILIIAFSGIKLNQSYSSLPTIYYDGQEKEFTYFNTNDTDLFSNLKEMMPGDVREQEILLKVDNIKKNTKLFLNVNEKSDNEISEFIKLYIDNKELKESEEYIELGTFSKDANFILKVVLQLPKELGNEIEDLEYNIDWNILVQEESGDLLEVPQTYDNSNIIIYIILCIVSIIAMLYSMIILIKTRNK